MAMACGTKFVSKAQLRKGPPTLIRILYSPAYRGTLKFSIYSYLHCNKPINIHMPVFFYPCGISAEAYIMYSVSSSRLLPISPKCPLQSFRQAEPFSEFEQFRHHRCMQLILLCSLSARVGVVSYCIVCVLWWILPILDRLVFLAIFWFRSLWVPV